MFIGVLWYKAICTSVCIYSKCTCMCIYMCKLCVHIYIYIYPSKERGSAHKQWRLSNKTPAFLTRGLTPKVLQAELERSSPRSRLFSERRLPEKTKTRAKPKRTRPFDTWQTPQNVRQNPEENAPRLHPSSRVPEKWPRPVHLKSFPQMLSQTIRPKLRLDGAHFLSRGRTLKTPHFVDQCGLWLYYVISPKVKWPKTTCPTDMGRDTGPILCSAKLERCQQTTV